jgi:hypothetical protein
VKTTTYVKSVEAFLSTTSRVTFVRVELATGHTYTCQPHEAPRVGDALEVSVEAVA